MQIIPMNQVDKEAKEKVSTAKISLLTKPEYTFFTSALLRLNLMYSKDVPTLATDGLNVIINPDFVIPLTNRNIAFALMHETMHVIYGHLDRLATRDHKTWNIATDYVINNQLDNIGMDVIEGICLDHQYDGMSADEVYNRIKEDPNTPNQSPSFDDLVPTPLGGAGQVDSNGNPIPSMSPQQVQQAVSDIMDQAIVAAQQAGGAGNIPSDLQRAYDEKMRPKINWKQALQDFMFSIGKAGSSFKRPSRRGTSLGITLPGKHGKGLGRIDFAIDTSGSVSEEMFNQFVSEISSVFIKLKPKEIGIIQFDTEVKNRDVVKNVAEFAQIKFLGGGGTDVTDVLKMFEKLESKAMVILTDGYFRHDKSMDPKKPVVWAIYDNPSWVPPFGKAIHFKI